MNESRIKLLPLGERNEKALLDQLQTGKLEAFELLYRHYAERVMGLARQLLKDPQSAEDATQETFIRIFRSVRKFREGSRLSTWIHRIAVNVCLTELERRKRWPSTLGVKNVEEIEKRQLTEATPSGEVALSLTEVLRRLDPVKQVTFYLHHVEGLTAAEIALALGESRASINKRLQRTRNELVEMWKGAGPLIDQKAGAAARGTP